LTILEKIARKHNDWISVSKSFGLDNNSAEDLVQDMYIKIHEWMERNGKNSKDLIYEKDLINYYLIFRTLRGLFIDKYRKESKVKKVTTEYIKHLVQEENKTKPKDVTLKMQQLDELLDSVYWYDKKVFNLISEGMSIAELSKKTGISYYSLYNTYKNVKTLIKNNNIQWD
jgi:DNA-directed RNA polymerase specialized sigma24 family protein